MTGARVKKREFRLAGKNLTVDRVFLVVSKQPLVNTQKNGMGHAWAGWWKAIFRYTNRYIYNLFPTSMFIHRRVHFV